MLLYLSFSQLLVLDFTILPLFILYAPKQKLIFKCIRWQSNRTWANLLLQEFQNYNLLLNSSRQENVRFHQKEITHIQGQRRSPGKTVQFSSVTQSCPTLCDPMNRSTPGLLVHHHLPEFTQTHVHRVFDAIQPSHPRSAPSPPDPNPSQHQSLF